MKLEEKLKIILITYNRSYFLNRTLKQLFAEDSPIKKCDITVLDNASTDNTAEIVSEYQKKFPNLYYKKNPLNIGGNANIVRAFETGAVSGKEYVWVLCDDDYYDWSNFDAVLKAMDDSVDCIGVARYVIPDGELSNPAYQFFQLTFVPAGIYKAELITDNVLTNMYDTIYSMFQQSCIAAHAINNSKRIHFLEKPIVENGLHIKDENEPRYSLSFCRGMTTTEISYRRKEQLWVIGFANIVRLLNSPELQQKCMEISIPYKDIYGSWENFKNCMEPFKIDKMGYLYEINKVLPDNRKIDVYQCDGTAILLSTPASKISFTAFLCAVFYKMRSMLNKKHGKKKATEKKTTKLGDVSLKERIYSKKIKKLSILQLFILLPLFKFFDGIKAICGRFSKKGRR